MKSFPKFKYSSRLTFRFILYFVLFYLIIIIGTVSFLGTFIYIMSESIGDNIHNYDTFDLEDDVIKTKDGYKISDSLKVLATENSGQIYLLNQSSKILDYSGETCELCNLPKNELMTMDTKGLFTWKLSNNLYLLFVPKSPLLATFNNIVEEWTSKGSLSPELQGKLENQHITVELYDHKWKRSVIFGEKKEYLFIPDFIANHSDLFEQKEWVHARSLPDGSTIVARMNNDFYKPFMEPFSKGMTVLVLFFLIFHILLFIGTMLLSIGISNRFVRPIMYILSRIENLAQFNYGKIVDKKMHHKKTGKLKRKFKLFQPVDDSINNLADRLSYNERQIKNAEQLREEWITGLSHDLKTPLSSIYGYSTMLASEEYNWTPEETRTFAKLMQEKANYMDALIQDLTYTYQLKSKHVHIDKETIDVKKFLTSYEDNQVTVKSEENIFITADPILLQRIIDNIVGNAKKHTPEGTPITIDAIKMDGAVKIRIADEGPGIPQKELDNIFERYYRGTNTTDDINGTGLGLAIAKQLIELHEASVHVHSDECGTVFEMVFHESSS